jgi:uroporphyrinogen-III decarboxylase
VTLFTEHSAHQHWDLIRAETGLPVTSESTDAEKQAASQAFVGAKHWDYGFMWSVLIHRGKFGSYRTSMGHAVYADGGGDFRADAYEAFATPGAVLAFDPVESLPQPPVSELVERFERHYRENEERWPDAVNMTGIYVTCVSGLIDLFGWDKLLLAAGMDPEGFGRVTERYQEWIGHYFRALAEADVPAVMVHDHIVWTSGPFIRPDWYRRYVFPGYRANFAPLVESGKRIFYTSDGDYTLFLDDVAQSGVHGFVMEPLTDMQAVADRYGDSHFFVGNVDTRALLSGDRETIRGEVERCMEIGKRFPGSILAVGNHIPANTPVDAAIYYNELYQELRER